MPSDNTSVWILWKCYRRKLKNYVEKLKILIAEFAQPHKGGAGSWGHLPEEPVFEQATA
jgi:hypothetical protein